MSNASNQPGKHLQVGSTSAQENSAGQQPLVGEIVSSAPTPLESLDRISFVMDRLFEIPGTRLRLGLNTFLLLLPVLGDIIPSLVSVLILIIGLNHYRVPRIVAARMVLNTILDAALGWIPIVGDLFDLFFKADTRNVRLLQQYAGPTQSTPSTWHHWLFVVLVLLCLGALFVGLVLGAFLLIRWLNHTINHMFGL
jgi:hypothetical protein